MRSLLSAAAAFVVATAMQGCDGSGSSDDAELRSESFEWTGQVVPGGEIEIRGVGGDVTFSSATGDDVEVEAVKSGRRDDPATVTIEVVQHAGGVRICAVYPDVPGQGPNSCAPGGNLSSRNNDVEVDFTVRAPPGRRLEAGMVGGNLTALGVANEVVLTSLGGDIVISTTDIAEATTLGGNVTVTIGSTDPVRDLRFSTMSGNVTVTVPAGINAVADLSALSGTVSSNFALPSIGPRHLHGPLGAGGATVTLVTSAGNVRLLRGP